MRTIWKYELTGEGTTSHSIPKGAVLRHSELQGSVPTVWLEVDPNIADFDLWEFAISGTGWPYDESEWTWLALFQDPPFVWHILWRI